MPISKSAGWKLGAAKAKAAVKPSPKCKIFGLAFSSFAFSRKAANAFWIEGYLSCVSFFAENSLKAAVSASASLPLKNT
ncbi:hypothetical protein C816_02102 [Oscillibacter sp. 1-3]|nr:hypothetical protein C816_02102 [Oscillibacter sp. 1-3]